MHARPVAPEPDLTGLVEGAKAHEALLRELFKGIIPLLARPDVPLFIKTFITGLIFLGISTSSCVVILLAQVFSPRQIDVRPYLVFLISTLALLLLSTSLGARSAQRFESEKGLEANMNAVTRSRRSRLTQSIPESSE